MIAGRTGSSAVGRAGGAAQGRADTDAEQVVLVDSDDRATGAAGKLFAHRAGLRHRAFSIFLFDRDGRTLLQQRNAEKYHSGGLWANACCGHPRPDEGTAAAATRRLYEELGARAPLQEGFRTAYEAGLLNGLTENEVVTVFSGPAPAELAPNPDEVAATRFVDLPALLAEVAARPQDFAVWLVHYLQRHHGAIEAMARQARDGK